MNDGICHGTASFQRYLSDRREARWGCMEGMDVKEPGMRRRQAMRIIYEELCIRNAEEADCAQLAKWWNDGSVMAHAGFPRGLGITAEEIREQIKYDSDQTPPGGGYP